MRNQLNQWGLSIPCQISKNFGMFFLKAPNNFYELLMTCDNSQQITIFAPLKR